MILLKSDSAVIHESLKQKSSPEQKEKSFKYLDIHFSDHAQAAFHLVHQHEKESLRLSLAMPAWRDVKKHANGAAMTKYVQQPFEEAGFAWNEGTSAEDGYDVSVACSSASLTDDQISLMASLRQRILAAPMLGFINSQKSGNNAANFAVQISLGAKETFAIASVTDHIVVIFATVFSDPTDVVLAKVFLQELHDMRKQQAGLQDAPTVVLGKEPPSDVAHLLPKRKDDDLNYISFVLFPRHYASDEQAERLCALIPTYRDYLHYHLKCTKAYLHGRMRAKTTDFLKILNRAKPENF